MIFLMSRWCSGLSKQRSTVRIPVGVGALLLLTLSNQSNASTGSDWSQQSSWPNSDDPTPVHHSTHTRELPTNDISPFSPGSSNVALDIGQVFLMGNLSQFSDSIGSQLHYTYGVSDLFGFDSSLGYSAHSDGKMAMTTLLSGVRMNLSWYDKIVPYLVFGLGFYKPTYQDPSTITANSSNTASSSLSAVLFGLHLGPGIDLELSRNLFFGAALTFHSMFGTTQSLANGTPFDLGGTYTSFFLHAGVTF